MAFLIIKADGSQEPFDRAKLHNSLRKAGASGPTADEIVTHIEQTLRPNMHTGDIYRDAFAQLRKKEPNGTAARYSLRRALQDLGPSGFPFEAYLAELFRKNGYEAQTNLIINGKCIDHEIDVLLSKNGVRTYVEAKFHNTPGFKTDLKVALYVKARIDDLRGKDSTAEGMIVTNTKLTTKAFAYALCAGLPVLTWDYPHGKSLHTLIDHARLFPVTALASLSKKEKMALMSQKIVLCNSLPRHEAALKGLNIPPGRLKNLFEEVGNLCQ